MTARSPDQDRDDVPVTAQVAAEIGGRIRRLRGSETQEEFGARIGIRREHVSRIENGVIPRGGTLRRLAEVTHASVDAVLFGAASPAAEAASSAASWDAALEPLLAGTTLRLPRAPAASARKADRAWRQLTEPQREEIRTFVRRVALLAVTTEGLLPPKAARAVTDELSSQLTTVLIDRILST